MSITQTEALNVVSLLTMKTELRIPDPGGASDHDTLIAGQIHSAANFVMASTSRPLSDLHLLRAAIIAAVRSQYDGGQEIRETAAAYAWMEPFRKIV